MSKPRDAYCEVACQDFTKFLCALTEIRFVDTDEGFESEGEVVTLEARHPKHGPIFVGIHANELGSWGFWAPR